MDRRRAHIVSLLYLALAACASSPPGNPSAPPPAASDADWEKARPMTVRLSDFAFAPSHLALEAGVPVRLTLVNESRGAHDFSVPGFFATASYPKGATPPPDGDVAVPGGQSLEIEFVPMQPGTYPLECTHFLHALFGMTGEIEVANRS